MLVDPDRPVAQRSGDPQGASDVVGPDARGEPEYGVVGFCHRLGFGVEALEHDKGTKNFLLAEERIRVLVPNQRRREKGAFCQTFTRDLGCEQYLIGSDASFVNALGDLISGASINKRADL